MILVVGASAGASGYVSVRFNSVSTNKYSYIGNNVSLGSTYSANNWSCETIGPDSSNSLDLGNFSGNAASVMDIALRVFGASGTGLKPYSYNQGSSLSGGTSGNYQKNGGGVFNDTNAITSV